MKKILSIALIFVLCFSISAFAAEEPNAIVNELNIGISDMVLESCSTSTARSASNTTSKTYSAIVVIDKYGNATVQNDAIVPYGSTSNSGENVYWKATVTITYNLDSTNYGNLTDVSGSWIQLHGSATINGRSVSYYQATTTGIVRGYKAISSNSFNYATGFAKATITNGFSATSTATVTTQAGSKLTLNATAAF